MRIDTVDVAQLVRASDCGSEGRGFEPLLPPSRRKKITPQREKPYVSMIRKVFCFRGIVYSESGCPSPDPAPFVPVREEDANCVRCVGFHRCAFNSLHAAYVRPFRVMQPCAERYFPFFLPEAPDFQEGPSTRLCPYHRFALSLRPKSTPAAKSGRSVGTGASRTFAGHRDS